MMKTKNTVREDVKNVTTNFDKLYSERQENRKKLLSNPKARQLVKMLKADKDFTPTPVNDGDELYPNGIFVFNITRMIEHIAENPNEFESIAVEVDDFSEAFSSITESHVDSVDISQPVILAEIAPGHYNLIDGNHRMEKARRMGTKSVSAFRLSVKQHIKFLTSKKAYLSYVEYWNGKVKSSIY